MRPSIARVTLRAASSLVARNSARPATTSLPSSGRSCSTSAIPNDPVVKHSTVGQVSSADTLRSSGVPSSSANSGDESVRAPSSVSVDSPSTAASSSNPTDTVTTSDGQDTSSSYHESLNTSTSVGVAPIETSSSSTELLDSGDSVSISSEPSENMDESTPTNESYFISPGETSEDLIHQIRGYLRRNAVRSALFHFLSAMKIEGNPAIDAAVLKLVLPVLGRQGWAPTALDAINLALSRDFNLEVGLYNCGLHAMARSGDYDTVNDVIKRMWALPFESRPNATSYNYLIGSYMYRGAVDRAFDVLHEMKNHMLYPTFATYHALISGCLRSNDPRRAYTTLNAVERQRFDIGAMTISQVLVSCADADLSDEVMHLLPRLDEALPSYANEVHRIAEKRQAYRMAVTAMNKVKTTPEDRAVVRGTPKPEIGAISAILHCAFRNCRPDLAVSGWGLLRKYYDDVDIPETLWYCIIGAFAGAGDFQKAFEVMGVMRENGYDPRLKDLDVALVRPLSLEINKVDEQYYKLCDMAKGLTAAKAGNGASTDADAGAGDGDGVDSDVVDKETSKATVQEIEPVNINERVEASSENVEQGQEGDVDSSVECKDDEFIRKEDTSSLRDVLAERVTKQEAEEQWKEMVPKSVGINELNCVIAACSFAGDLDRAFQTYDEVESVFGLEKNVETYNALLEGCIQVKHVRGGMRIISEMEKVGMKLEGESLQLAVRLLTRAARAPECIDLVKKVRSEGGKISLQTYLLLVRYFVRGNAMDNAMDIYEMGLEDGFDARTLRGRLDGEGLNRLREALGDFPENVEEVAASPGEAAGVDRRHKEPEDRNSDISSSR